jgi:ribonuclease HI
MGFGSGSNNYAELMALKLLLLFAKEKQVTSLQIFGDSQLVVKWVQNHARCQNIMLRPILEEVQRILNTFDDSKMHHVYRERNEEADQLSKEGLSLDPGKWMIKEEDNDTFYEFYHQPFMDPPLH